MDVKSRASRKWSRSWLGATSLWSMFLAPVLTCPAVAGPAAAPPASFAPAIRETQLMLYVSRPFGFKGATHSYGLRVDQASAPPLTAASIPLGPLHRKELLNLRITPNVRTQIQVGGRLNWDLRDGRVSLERR